MDDQNLLIELLNTDEFGEQSKFELLQTWQEYKVARKVRRTTKVVLRWLSDLSNNQFKNYCRSVKSGATEVNKLIAYVTLKKVEQFYLEELRIIEDSIDEYETYLLSGNWPDFILNLQRPVDKQWDHRGK